MRTIYYRDLENQKAHQVVITGKTQLLGVMGYPVAQSLSPTMHNAAINHLGVDYIYIPLQIKPEDLQVAVAGLAAIGMVGFNVTIPHKQTILPLLSEVSPLAAAVGAVNTVWRTEHGWAGTNTDVTGFIAPLKTLKQDWSQTVAVVLGNGGAARAVVAGCAQLGCAEIHVVGRNPQKLEQFRDSWAGSSLTTMNLQVHLWQELPLIISQANLLVNSTPTGMYPHEQDSPLHPAQLKLPSGAIVYDLIYRPLNTKFLRQAQDQGAMTINGLEMFVQQGAAALEIWLQQSAPVEVMYQAVQQQLSY